MMPTLALLVLPLANSAATAQSRLEGVPYHRSGGTVFTMDVVRPATPSRAAIVFVVSGGWISDHSMLKSFMPDIERHFVESEFTVFEVVHGAQPRYRVVEIVDQVSRAARFVRAHAADYGVDPDRIGIAGISSGGHLALMAAGASGVRVAGVAAISPPTDLANWGKPGSLLTDLPSMSLFKSALGIDSRSSRKAAREKCQGASPVEQVSAKYPSTLIVHGVADPVVPFQQARALEQALARHRVDHEFLMVWKGGHDETTFSPGIVKAVRWFRSRLMSSTDG